MKKVKYIVLEVSLLIAMMFCGTATMKIMDMKLLLEYENIWSIGFKVGFIAWLCLLLVSVIRKVRNNTKD